MYREHTAQRASECTEGGGQAERRRCTALVVLPCVEKLRKLAVALLALAVFRMSKSSNGALHIRMQSKTMAGQEEQEEQVEQAQCNARRVGGAFSFARCAHTMLLDAHLTRLSKSVGDQFLENEEQDEDDSRPQMDATYGNKPLLSFMQQCKSRLYNIYKNCASIFMP